MPHGAKKWLTILQSPSIYISQDPRSPQIEAGDRNPHALCKQPVGTTLPYASLGACAALCEAALLTREGGCDEQSGPGDAHFQGRRNYQA